jgi:hypothetical protein
MVFVVQLRSAMVRLGEDLLTGRVEVDECYMGGLEEGLRGRLIESKALVIWHLRRTAEASGEPAFA